MSALMSVHTNPGEECSADTLSNSIDYIQTLTDIVHNFRANPYPSFQEMLGVVMQVRHNLFCDLNDEERVIESQLLYDLRQCFINIRDTAAANANRRLSITESQACTVEPNQTDNTSMHCRA
eukprot:GHVR01133392.1.p1 GENE.GHVR01133392.1~~GHVR01133392.1.p1  ORF type:complete len:122 (+),score=8.38 GHVR01133392.1:75-440(+)